MKSMDDDPLLEPKSTPAASGSTRFGTALRALGKPSRGALGQAWLNLVVWYPFLLGGGLRSRRVIFDGREASQGGKWSVSLPKQCWCCGTQQRVESQQLSHDVRTYDIPPALLLLGAIAVALLLVIGLFKWWILVLVLGLVLLAAGAGLLVLKSWREPVRVMLWSCPTHSADARFPDVVIHDNELHLFAPSVSLAEAATAELLARRRQGRRYAEDASTGPAAQPESARPPRAPRAMSRPPRRPALPVRCARNCRRSS